MAIRFPLSTIGALVFLASTAVDSWSAPITFANAVLADNPTAYWRFGESPGATTAADAAIGHDGTYLSGVTLGQAGIGGGDTGALFDGVNGRVTVPDDAELGPDLITMEALVRWDGPNTLQQRILENSFFAGGEQASYGLSILPDGAIQVEVRSGGGATSHTSAALLGLGAPAHIVATFDGALVSMYLDGVFLQSTSAIAGSLQDGINPLGIGNQFERNRPFNGLIDEVALYDYALSRSQVEAHFAAIQQTPEPGTAGLLLMAVAALSIASRKR
jgi:hypothetical protein